MFLKTKNKILIYNNPFKFKFNIVEMLLIIMKINISWNKNSYTKLIHLDKYKKTKNIKKQIKEIITNKSSFNFYKINLIIKINKSNDLKLN